MPPVRPALAAALACSLTLPACIDRTVTSVSPEPSKEERTEFPVAKNRDLDLLFVIDSSRSMLAEQDSLAVNFDRIANALESLEEGLPNIHIGVVSTDVGAGGHGGCSIDGDDGALQSSPRVAGCTPPDGAFIRNIDGDANYSGTLSETFSCIARIGDQGCGFEQPLESMRRALDGSNPANAGFLRPNALLAVVFITDEDDCSTFDPAMFARVGEPGVDLGAQKSFRCFEFGVTCDGDVDPRTPGTRSDCQPRNDSPFMPEVQEYVTFLKELKQFDSQILVAGIVGAASPILVTRDAQDDPCLMYSCGDVEVCGDAEDQPAAVPPIRLQAFLEAFPLNHVSTICDDDLSMAVQSIADWIKDGLDGRCVQGELRDIDPATPGLQPDCAVTETRFPNTANETARTLLACDDPADPAASTNLPCYALVEDELSCATTPQHLSVEIYYPTNETVPPDTLISARCLAN